MKIDLQKIEDASKEIYIRALKLLPPDIKQGFARLDKTETDATGKAVLGTMIRNIKVAEDTNNLLCQDTGIPIYNVVIGRGVVIGNDCRIGANCVITHAMIGNRVVMGPNNSIGNQGFSFVPSQDGLLRVPQLGRVVVEDEVEFGSNCTADRGAIGDTHIERGVRFDSLIHVGHNVRIGHHSLLVAQVGIGGSTTVGPMVLIGGQVGISDHLTIGAGARLAARSGVTRDIGVGERVGGYPARPLKRWHRETALLAKMAKPKKPNDQDGEQEQE